MVNFDVIKHSCFPSNNEMCLGILRDDQRTCLAVSKRLHHKKETSFRNERRVLTYIANLPPTKPTYMLQKLVGLNATTIFTRFVHGCDLFDIWDHYKSMCAMKRLAISLMCCRAVVQCHARHVFHGDIKVENFMFDAHSHSLVLIDFEMGKVVSNGYQQRIDEPQGGTVGYSAPELLREHNPTASLYSDVFSLGCLVWFMIFNEFPDGFEDERTMRGLCELYKGREIKAMKKKPNEYTEVFQDVFHTVPSRRPTAKEFMQRLESFIFKYREVFLDSKRLCKCEPKTENSCCFSKCSLHWMLQKASIVLFALDDNSAL